MDKRFPIYYGCPFAEIHSATDEQNESRENTKKIVNFIF